MQLNFGAGLLWGTEIQDAGGNNIATPTPVKFGVLQEVTLDIEFTTKQLYGSQQFPVAIGRGPGKVTGNAKHAQINGAILSNLFFGQASSAGTIGVVNDVTGETVPATPYMITPTVPGSGTWAADLGVLNANGDPLTAVASGPTTGQYEVAAGVYTFAAADTGNTVFINYKYTATGTLPKQKSTVISELMGYSPTFSIDLSLQYKGTQLNVHLYQATSSKLSLMTKLEDFMIPEFSFEAFANASGQVLDWSTSE